MAFYIILQVVLVFHVSHASIPTATAQPSNGWHHLAEPGQQAIVTESEARKARPVALISLRVAGPTQDPTARLPRFPVALVRAPVYRRLFGTVSGLREASRSGLKGLEARYA